MIFTIPTIYRDKENYLYQTLDDAIEKDVTCLNNNHFDLFIGNRTKLNELVDNIWDTKFAHKCFTFQINHLTSFEWAMIEDRTVNVRFNMNFMRCMSAAEFTEDILYFEDDILFAKNWYTKLMEYIEILDRQYNKRYILSLYAPFQFSHKRLVDEIPFGHYYGTQSVYIKKEFQKGLYDKIFKDGIVNFKHQADLLLGEYAYENNIPVLCLTTSLVQHLGKESTGLGNFHSTNNFKLE